MQRVGALADDLDVIDMGLIADEHFKRGVGLIAAAGRAFIAFDHHHARAFADHHQRTGETRRRLFRRGEDEMQRPLDGRTGAHADHGAVAHQRRVERDRNVARGRKLAEMPHQLVVVLGERGGERSDRQPLFQRRGVGQFRHERAVDKNNPQRLALVEQRAGALGARFGLRIGRGRERLCVAHQRAQIGIFPVLDPAMRQAFACEHVESGRPLLRDRLAAGQLRPRLRKRLRQRRLRRGFDDFQFSHGSIALEHDPEKWKPVFRKDHAQTKC